MFFFLGWEGVLNNKYYFLKTDYWNMFWSIHFWRKKKVSSPLHVAEYLQLGCDRDPPSSTWGLPWPGLHSSKCSHCNHLLQNPERLNYADDSVSNLAAGSFRNKNCLCGYFFLLHVPCYRYRVLLEESIVSSPKYAKTREYPIDCSSTFTSTDLFAPWKLSPSLSFTIIT